MERKNLELEGVIERCTVFGDGAISFVCQVGREGFPESFAYETCFIRPPSRIILENGLYVKGRTSSIGEDYTLCVEILHVFEEQEGKKLFEYHPMENSGIPPIE